MVIVVRTDVPLWQQVNAVGHCAAYLGNKMATLSYGKIPNSVFHRGWWRS